MFKKVSAIILMLCFICMMVTGCGQPEVKTNLPKPDMTRWQYDADNEVYYQLGIVYCETPADENYEQLAVFVPAAYMDSDDNGDGTYTCKLNKSAEINGYTASKAPIVMPINTTGYAASEPLTEEMLSEYAADYHADLEKTDSVGNTVEQRVDMYAPLYYLMESREGFGTSNVAKYWRIRSGIEQPTTSLTTEVNLALALEQYDGVESVNFETVWAKGHDEAERTGKSTVNFIEWVNTCMKD